MSNQLNFASLDKVVLFSVAQEFAKRLEMYLKRIGLTENEIRFLDTQGALFYWQIIIDDYISGNRLYPNYRLHDMTIFIAKMIIAAIPDHDLRNKMSEFIERPSVENAVDIKRCIGNTVKQENIKFLVEKVAKVLNQGGLQ